MSELSGLLNKLAIRNEDAEADSDFHKELAETQFTIFKPVADLGYFSWKPELLGAANYMVLSTLKSTDDVRRYIDINGEPDRLKSVKGLQLPKRFVYPEPRKFDNKYPYGQFDIGCLYVAAKHRGLDLSEVNFAFGGSTLEMLANKDASTTYVATRVPGTGCILIVKRKEYTQDLADPGFQFERFVTGKSMSDTNNVEFVEHMHLSKIGEYKVLFRAETDATLHGSPVEIKASNPRYWGTKVMFQMISSGSAKLCHGEKFRGAVTRVTLKSLSTVAREALEKSNVTTLQYNILEGMEAIQFQLKDNELRKITFSGGSLKLIPTSGRSSAVLPPAEVTKSLLR